MRFAVISDIHNNLEAFRTALDDISKQNVEKICCLGDLLGYGPNPLECVDLMMDLRKKGKVETCLLGNHDQATLFDPEGFNAVAEAAVFWTRGKLEGARGARAAGRWDFLGEIPRMVQKDPFMFVHGSPRNPLNEYVFPEDVDEKEKMSKLFALVKKYCFVGHTHVPGVFVEKSAGSEYDYYAYEDVARDFDGVFPLGDQKLIVNVGSIGQPRDMDPRSCYVVVQYEEGGSDNRIEYRRVTYDVEKTANDLMQIKELQDYDFLWRRIKEGR